MPFALNFVQPLLMWVLLGLMLCSGYLGFKASLIRRVGTEERKALVPLHHGQRHAQLGAVNLSLTLLGAADGLTATFLKNGKDWARGLHVAINGGMLLLFGRRAFTGIAIVHQLPSSAASPTSLGT